jgi:hypothetical protein
LVALIGKGLRYHTANDDGKGFVSTVTDIGAHSLKLVIKARGMFSTVALNGALNWFDLRVLPHDYDHAAAVVESLVQVTIA